ncbi:MAG: DUF3781 domain-containing protein [Lachnospiraceae bacterium]|nr:DUF3781 domain-containing protein [Lachnospiraceae bacterium]
MNDLIENIEKLHTTERGVERIKRNLSIETDDVVAWCREKILDKDAVIERAGKGSERKEKMIWQDQRQKQI